MTVMIIGGAGNIGPSIVHALRVCGHVPIVVSKSDKEIDGVKHIRADYRAVGFGDIVKSEKPEAVISMITFDGRDAQILLDACRGVGVRQIVFISTVCVYGGPLKNVPATENTPLMPITAYGIDKADAEMILLNQADVPVTIFRLASTAGPQFPILRQLSIDKHNHWIRRVRAGKSIILADDGLQRWSWCAASDAARPIAACIGRELCFHQVYNLTRPYSMTWVEYHSRIARLVGREHQFVFLPSNVIIASDLPSQLLREQSSWDQSYSVEKLQNDFPLFSPLVSFEEMIVDFPLFSRQSSYRSCSSRF